MGVQILYNGQEHFIDNFANDSHDSSFTMSAWLESINYLKEKNIYIGKDNINELIIWSDGGLKSKENLHFFQSISNKNEVTITVNFFAPYHGHSTVSISLF